MEGKKLDKPETLPAEVRANMLSNETSIYFNVALFEQVQRVATIFANSTMVPNHFRGNVGNCMIALNYAYRLRADEFMVFQNLYEVGGTPGIQAKLVEAVINQSGKYSEPLQYEWLDPADNIVSRQEVLKADIPSDYGCQAFTIDKKSGTRVTGPKITWALIKGRGWYDRKGADKTVASNNWRTMPEMMFYYRSTAWFGNKNCSELTLGMYTVDELQDIVDLKKVNGAYAIETAAEKLTTKGNTLEPGKDIYAPKEVETPEKPTKAGPDGTPKKPEKEAEDPSAKEVEEPTRKLYMGLTKLKFNKFLKGHKANIPGMAQKYKDEIRVEHQKHFPGQEYPIDDSLPEEDKPEIPNKTEEPELSEEEKEAKILKLVEGSEADDMKGLLVPCPNRDNALIKFSICDVCMYKERVGCPTWVEFDKAQ